MNISAPIPSFPFRLVPRNKMLICSFATGDHHIAMLQIMAPTVAYYAMLHRMDSLLLPLPDQRLDPSRPPAWDKIIFIYHALKVYDTVMWIDADAIFCNPNRDIRKDLNPKCLIHLVAHRHKDKLIPNTGVWILQKDKRTFQLLEAIWNHTEFMNHPWWEQAAFMDLIGYEPRNKSSVFRGKTRYTPLVHYLKEEWNSRRIHPAKDPYIIHCLGKNKTIEEMHKRYKEFLKHLWIDK